MAARPIWQGHLRLSLVTCPVALYSATSSAAEVSFHLINPKTDNRIRMVATDPDSGPVERSKLVKGYEVEKDRYILVTDEEIASVRVESTKVIDIDRFVDEDEIDRLYWKDPFFLVPDGKMAAEAYAVIREAMARSGRIALGRVVLHSRERMMAVEPRGDGMIAYSLRSRDEVRKAADYFRDIPPAQPDAKMVEIAQAIIKQQEGPFEPDTFIDRYQEALKALIAEKTKGHKPKLAPAPEPVAAGDLMEALRRSLQGGGGSAARRPSGSSGAPRAKATAKTARRSPAHRKAG
jgi:DNA end-binding protein Ku